LTDETKEKLNKLGEKGETYDEIVRKIIEKAKLFPSIKNKL